MSWSGAEVSALAAKAARGAGAPAGQAALFGQAAALHLQQGRGAGALAEALETLPEGPIMDLPLVLQEALPVARSGGEIDVVWAGDVALAWSYLETMPYRCDVELERPGGLKVRFSPRSDARPRAQRISGCEELLHKMATLAAKTLVPDSAASRSGGAGAGLTDND
ncbi:hypothetical protein [uncultured Roseobacter sp.]|uniref:hypothetical protein n=1 Tax=uncultured Roseobacter sp. TaxID=114847 RepID=UPI002620EC75|nr:hypothetical protein [uncultured Roseobacter sp.]